MASAWSGGAAVAAPVQVHTVAAADMLGHELASFETLEATGAGEAVRVWAPHDTAVIVGQSSVVAREVQEDACRADGVPILRRQSGGGAVVVGPGCLLYSLALSLDVRPELRHVRGSYGLILGRMARALAPAGLDIRGTCDLTLHDRKVGGSAQRRGRRALLHHGTLLVAFDLSLIDRYLREPARQPSYRAGRRHADFVANLPLDIEEAARRLTSAWATERGQSLFGDGKGDCPLFGRDTVTSARGAGSAPSGCRDGPG